MSKKLTYILLAQLSLTLLSPGSHAGEPDKSASLSTSSHAGEPGQSTKVALEDQPQDLVEHIVWAPERPLIPQFLPAPVLQQADIETIAIHEESRSALTEYIAFEKRELAAGKSTSCHRTSEEAFAEHETPNGRSLIQLLEVQDTVALGTVRSLVPGWGGNQPLTMVYVETQEILHCRPGFGDGYAVRNIAAGDMVSTTLDAGSFELEGVTLCSWTPKAFVFPRVGDQVLIAGSPRPEDPYFLGHWGIVSLLENGEVRPQPYSNLQWDLVPLESVKAGLNGPHSACVAGDR